MHCIVQLLKKTPQTEENDNRDQECIDILFEPAQIKHYGSFQHSEYGTRKNFQNLNFAIPLVILTWHRMLQEIFWKNSDHTFFELGNYCGQQRKNTKQPLDNLHMIDGFGDESKIICFDMFCPNRDDDLVKKVCPSLLKWANYLLEPYEDIENKDKSELKSDNYQSGSMQSYNITDDAIKWKSEIPSETTPSAE